MSAFHKDVIFMLSIKIANVVPLSNMQLLVFFENGVIKKFDVKPIIKDYPEFEALKEPALFQMVIVRFLEREAESFRPAE